MTQDMLQTICQYIPIVQEVIQELNRKHHERMKNTARKQNEQITALKTGRNWLLYYSSEEMSLTKNDPCVNVTGYGCV